MTAYTTDAVATTVRYFTEPLEGLNNTPPLDMVFVPGGAFNMGSLPNELERADSEGPQRQVTLSSFFVGRYPITQAQWRTVANLPPVDRTLAPNPSRFTGDSCPVEQVLWYDAVEFCARLKQHTTRPYRLLTEAEWEYACRAGTTTPFAFGPTLTTQAANYKGNTAYADGPRGEYRQRTTPVDEFGVANAFGLCDMHGNVWEWCADQWHDTYEAAPADGSNWSTDDSALKRVIRGGSWDDSPAQCRSAARYFNTFGVLCTHRIGFRICCATPKNFSLRA